MATSPVAGRSLGNLPLSEVSKSPLSSQASPGKAAKPSNHGKPPKLRGTKNAAHIPTGSLCYTANPTSAPNAIPTPIAEQQMRGRIASNLHVNEHSAQGELVTKLGQCNLDERSSVGREDSNGHSEAAGAGTSDGLLSALAALGLRLGPEQPPNRDSERDHMKGTTEIKLLQDELLKARRQLEKYGAELQRTTAEGRVYHRALKELQTDNLRLKDNVQKLEHELISTRQKFHHSQSLSDARREDVSTQALLSREKPAFITGLVQKARSLEAFLAVGTLPLLVSLKAMSDAVDAASDFLVDNIVFRDSEAFTDELDEARTLLSPWLGAKLLHLLATHAQGSARGSDTPRVSRVLIRVASRALVYPFCYCNRSNSMSRSLLKANASMFKIASWALAGATTRTAFEAALQKVISAAQQVLLSLEKVPPNISVFSPGPEAPFDWAEMGAVDPSGEPLTHTLAGSEIVVAALAFGIKKGSMVALPSQVLLRSTLERALLEEEKEELNSPQPSMMQPNCDGRA